MPKTTEHTGERAVEHTGERPPNARPARPRLVRPARLAALVPLLLRVGGLLTLAAPASGSDDDRAPGAPDPSQATAGLLRLLTRRPELAAAARVSPRDLRGAATLADAYGLLDRTLAQIAERLGDGLLVLRGGAARDARRLLEAARQLLGEAAADPPAQAELLTRFGAVELRAQTHLSRATRRTQRSAAPSPNHPGVATPRTDKPAALRG